MFFKNLKYSLLFFVFLISCNKDSVDPEAGSTEDVADVLSSLEDIELSSDYTWQETDVKTITLNNTSATINGTGASVTGSRVLISKSGTYRISGILTNGQIKVQTDDTEPVKIILNGVNITNGSSSAFFIDKAKKTILTLADGTINKLTDGTTYSETEEGQNATLYAQSYLAINGLGSLEVNGNFEDGIGGKDGLLINNGNIKVTAKDDGIRGKDFLVIRKGTFNVTSGGDALKSDNEIDTNFGYILIENGSFKVISGGDGVFAQTKLWVQNGDFSIVSGGGSGRTKTVSSKGIKGLNLVSLNGTFNIDAADDAIHSDTKIMINDGRFTISTADDGIRANTNVLISKGNINILKSYEGVEGKFISIENGDINITSSNDCLNATNGTRTGQNDGALLTINGGNIILSGFSGDPLDSNGDIKQTGGNITVHGPNSSPEVPIDYNGTYNLSGGFLIASAPGTQMFQAPSTTSTQNSLKLTFKAQNVAESLFNIQDESGTTLVTFKPLRKYIGIVYSSPKLVEGKTYTIRVGGTSTGESVGGVISDGQYSGGTVKGTFTVSSKVTSISNF